MKNALFEKNTVKLYILFLALIVLEAFYSFLAPAYNPKGDYWKTLNTLDGYKGYTISASDNKLIQFFAPLIKNYRMNGDSAGYMLLAHDFPQQYFRGHVTLLTRPLFPLMIFILSAPFHLFITSYTITFGIGLLLNIALFFFTIVLFYTLVKKYISKDAAFLSCLLLIFSPFAHTWLIQPETNVFGVFAFVLSLFLIHRYYQKPSFHTLVTYSLLIGTLMLGKKNFAIAFFILFLGAYAKRYKEAFLFALIHLIPSALWYLWITRVWHLPYYVDEISSFGVGVWLLNIIHLPWFQTFETFMNVVPNFITSLLYGFLVIPVLFALAGYSAIPIKRKNILASALILSFLLLFFLMNLYIPRLSFLLFVIIYPSAALGIERIAIFFRTYNLLLADVICVLIYLGIFILSNLNVFLFVPYGG